MKNITFALVVALLFWSVPARADNITVFDNFGPACGAPVGGGGCEDGESDAQPFSQSWDLEAFILNGNMLSMVGGFDFKNGNTMNGNEILSGDIFISTGTAIYGNGSLPFTGLNKYGWDYAIRLDFDRSTYYVMKIDSTSHVTNVNYIMSSAPYMVNDWDYDYDVVAGSAAPGGPGELNFVYETGLVFDGDTHNRVSGINLGFLGAKNITVKFTMACGNDDLIGKGTTVPEPTSVILLGLGLTGLGLGFSRKKK